MPKVKREAVAKSKRTAKPISKPYTETKPTVQTEDTVKSESKPYTKAISIAKTEITAKSKPKPSTKAKRTVKIAKPTKKKSGTVFFCNPDSSEGGFLSPWQDFRFEVKDVVYH